MAETPYQAHDALELGSRSTTSRSPRSPTPRRRPAADAPQLHGKDINGDDISGNQAFHWVVAGGGRRRRVRRGRGRRHRHQGAHPPAAADPERDGAARGGGPVQPRHRRADALEHDPEPAHRPLPLLGRHRGAGGQAARHRPGGGRRLRQQDRRLSRRLHHGVLLEDAGPAGQVDRDPQRELPGDDARPRPRPGRRARGHEGRQDHRACAAPSTPAWARTCRPPPPASRPSCTA